MVNVDANESHSLAKLLKLALIDENLSGITHTTVTVLGFFVADSTCICVEDHHVGRAEKLEGIVDSSVALKEHEVGILFDRQLVVSVEVGGEEVVVAPDQVLFVDIDHESDPEVFHLIVVIAAVIVIHAPNGNMPSKLTPRDWEVSQSSFALGELRGAIELRRSSEGVLQAINGGKQGQGER